MECRLLGEQGQRETLEWLGGRLIPANSVEACPSANNALSMYGNTCRLYALQSAGDYANNIRMIRPFRQQRSTKPFASQCDWWGICASVRPSDTLTPITTIPATFTYQQWGSPRRDLLYGQMWSSRGPHTCNNRVYQPGDSTQRANFLNASSLVTGARKMIRFSFRCSSLINTTPQHKTWLDH